MYSPITNRCGLPCHGNVRVGPEASARLTSTDRGNDAGVKGHDLVVVANRLPVHRVGDRWETSPGGLVRAMLGVVRARGGAWVGWNGDTSTDTPISAAHIGHPTLVSPACPTTIDDTELIAVPLSADEFNHYYERVANGALWPLFHDAIRESSFDATSWAVYRDVNRRFAEAAAGAAAPGATVWIHDYQLLLAPAMLRDLRPDLVVGFFLHIPFPPQELFMRMPWRDEIIHGMLGADLVGFQRPVGADNFVALSKRLVGADADGFVIDSANGHTTRVGTFPISIDVDEIVLLAERGDAADRVREIRDRLGNPRTIFLGVDRLDYTKGIDLRLVGFGALLRDLHDLHQTVNMASTADSSTDHVNQRPDIVLVQIAVPGREGVDSYVEERRVVEQLVGEVNGEHATIGYPVVHYIRRSLSLDELVPLYMAADVMLVTPRRDGMNLVAKEFVAARTDDTGVLVLSEFAGASEELTEALLVNPHDPDAILAALHEALAMSRDESAQRMKDMRTVVNDRDVHQWAGAFLDALYEGQTLAVQVRTAGQ